MDTALTSLPMGFLDHPGPLAFAHRGGAGDWPENTMPAFEAAVAQGYRYLETDVHCTSDGVLVAFHDDRLDRVTDRAGLIADLAWNEVATARVDGVEPIPRFDELVSSFPAARFNIDAKAESSVDALVDAVARLGILDRVCLASFSDRRIRRMRKALGPGLCHSLGRAGTARLRAASFGAPFGATTARCVQVPHFLAGRRFVDDRFLATAHGLGLQVHVWTIDDAAEMHELFDRGVDGIMTDRPTVLRDVLVERDEWIEPD